MSLQTELERFRSGKANTFFQPNVISAEILEAAQLVLDGERVYFCEMMQRLVPTEEMESDYITPSGVCHWDGDECKGGWRLLIHPPEEARK
jgi:hypothetical protein